jgi:hypothetical protein
MPSLYPAPRPAVLSGLAAGLPGVRQTLKTMAKLVKQYKTDSGCREVAQQVTRGLPSYDTVGEITALHGFCRDQIRYVQDVEGVETLQTPPYTLEMASGDCDDKSILLNTLLACVGYQTLFFAVGVNGGFYSHVLSGVRVGTRTIPLETIVPGAPVGWMPPDTDLVLPWNV